MASSQGRSIALIGASGNIGSRLVQALREKKTHTITIIQRPESTAVYSDDVAVKTGALDDEVFLADALRGQHVLIMTLGIHGMELQPAMIRAAAKAGVEYVLPVEFGSDPYAKLVEEVPLIAHKREVRQLVEDLGVGSWIAVVTNPWLEYNLASGLLGFNLAERRATLVNGGNTKLSITSFDRVGAAVAGLLSLPDGDLAQYKNKPFYIQSFHLTQREVLDSIMRVTKTTESDWTIETPDTESIQKTHGEAAKAYNVHSFHAVFLELHLREGYGGDYSHKVDLGKFNLEKEDLDQVVEAAVEHTKAW